MGSSKTPGWLPSRSVYHWKNRNPCGAHSQILVLCATIMEFNPAVLVTYGKLKASWHTQPFVGHFPAIVELSRAHPVLQVRSFWRIPVLCPGISCGRPLVLPKLGARIPTRAARATPLVADDVLGDLRYVNIQPMAIPHAKRRRKQYRVFHRDVSAPQPTKFLNKGEAIARQPRRH